MKLVIFEDGTYENFYPLTLSRAVFELRCGWRTLAEKIEHAVRAAAVGYLCRDWLAPVLNQRTDRPVNDPGLLKNDDLLIVNGRLIAPPALPASGPSELARTADGEVVYLRLEKRDVPAQAASLDALIADAAGRVKNTVIQAALARYSWDLVLQNGDGIKADFAWAGRSGIDGRIEDPSAVRGDRANVYVAPGATVHPFVCIDASAGPVYIDRDAEIHPFTRIEGPAYVGPKAILLGTKLREGTTVGPVCRVGGEVEESIIHGYSNKYHDGFLGHAYVGEWVNLGALTTNSDLKNDYTPVEVTLQGRKINTGSTKVGAIIGDHTKTSIGSLFNTGAVCGAMCVIMATGEPLPKNIPSFAWFVGGVVTKGFGRRALYQTAQTAMGRRKRTWTEADEALWDKVFSITADERDEAVKRGRKQLLGL